ncbi:MAG: ribonuclease J [Deltaproteobacteria bacterium]|nr:MAG: ribonuclease J [Deltaproteobacteria bacterium]
MSPAGSREQIGPIGVERFSVHHSIADATGLILDTPVGTVVHTGDFKIESDPCEGQRFDRTRLEEVANEGVRLLLSDSTGAEVDGRSRLERDAEAALRKWIARSPNRVVVATFSSNSFRLRAALRIARERGRKVCLLGMSVNKHTQTARALGLIPPVDSLLIAPEDVDALPPDEVLILAGGSQGEHGSALTRLARDDHSRVHLEAGDTVILSSRIIPGNELAVLDIINRLERRGLEVVTRAEHPEVHASGHGSREEQRTMIRILRPKAFVPVHGTHHHRRRHLELAVEEGIAQTKLIENGSVLEVTRDALRIVDRVRLHRRHAVAQPGGRRRAPRDGLGGRAHGPALVQGRAASALPPRCVARGFRCCRPNARRAQNRRARARSTQGAAFCEQRRIGRGRN